MTSYDAQAIVLWCLIVLATAASLYAVWQTRQRRKADVRMVGLIDRAEHLVDQLEPAAPADAKENR